MDVVIYHGDCNDGFCAAWLCHKAWPDAEYVPAKYGYSPPNVDGKDVLIVDFSYKRDVLLDLHARAKSLTVLDHHKTAQADLEGLDFCVFDMEESGASLTYTWLAGQGLVESIAPWLVHYVKDRDLWKWELPLSRQVNAALSSYLHTFKAWDEARKLGITKMAEEGKAILRYQSTVVDKHVRNSREATIAGHKVLAVNATTLFSEIAGELAKDRPFGVAWFDRQDGKRQFSLRSRDGGIDVSEVARQFGGGGHRNAAGFELSQDQLGRVKL